MDAGIIRDEFTFRAALWWTGRSRTLQAGEYRFDRAASAVDVIGRLARGDVSARPLTFPEGLTIDEMSRLFERADSEGGSSFVAAARDGSLIKDLDPPPPISRVSVPGDGRAPREAHRRSVSSGVDDRSLSSDIHRRSAATRSALRGLTTRQVVSLASLIEKGTEPDERPLVAAVYRNRLKIGMGLQADPTVVYALQKAGRYDGNIRRTDLAFDSPYNTYRYPGLPPGRLRRRARRRSRRR